jgi:hypothetical protein
MTAKYPELKLNNDQHETLVALMDTIFSSIDESEAEMLIETAKATEGHSSLSREELLAFAKAKASDYNITDKFLDSLSRAAAEQKLSDVTFALTLLGTRAGSLALTGHFKPYKDLSRKEREEVMKKWSTSSMVMLRSLHKVFFQLTANNVFKQPNCPLHKTIGYPGPDPEMHGAKHTDKLKERYEFLDIPEGVTELTYDVVVVGTGAGGGPTAATLAKAGKKVLVLEKAKYLHESEFELNEVHGYSNLYERGTIFSTLDGSVNIYAASAFGGATTVNWLASLKVCNSCTTWNLFR